MKTGYVPIRIVGYCPGSMHLLFELFSEMAGDCMLR